MKYIRAIMGIIQKMLAIFLIGLSLVFILWGVYGQEENGNKVSVLLLISGVLIFYLSSKTLIFNKKSINKIKSRLRRIELIIKFGDEGKKMALKEVFEKKNSQELLERYKQDYSKVRNDVKLIMIEELKTRDLITEEEYNEKLKKINEEIEEELTKAKEKEDKIKEEIEAKNEEKLKQEKTKVSKEKLYNFNKKNTNKTEEPFPRWIYFFIGIVIGYIPINAWINANTYDEAMTFGIILIGIIIISSLLWQFLLGGAILLFMKNPHLVFGMVTPYVTLIFWFALNSQISNTKVNNSIKKIPEYIKEHYKEDFKYAPINGTGSERFVKSNDTSFQMYLDLKNSRAKSIRFDNIANQIDKQYNGNLEKRKGIENIRKYIEENRYKYKENKSKYYKNDWILEISNYYYSEEEKNKFINLEIRVFTNEKNINIVKEDVYNIFKKLDERDELNYNFKIGIYKKEAETITENLWKYAIFSNTIERDLEKINLENNFGAPAIDTLDEFYLTESENEKIIYEIIRNSDKNFDNIGELNKLKHKKISFEFRNGKREPIQVALDEYFRTNDKTKLIRIIRFLISEDIDLDYINKNNRLSPATRIKNSGEENLMRLIDIKKYEDKKFDYLEYLKNRK